MTFRIVNVRSDESVLVRDIDGAFRGSMLVSFLMEDDLNQIYQLGFEGQIRETGTETWRSSFLLGPSTTEARFYNVEVGTEYDIRFRFIYSNETLGSWVSSWDDLDDDGNVIGTNTSHTVVGNTRLPPDCAGLTVTQTISGSILFVPSVTWVPQDFAAYEIRYILGFDYTDWDTMSLLTTATGAPFESSGISSGDYTFAVKLRNEAKNPAGDNITTFPTRYNESANAFFANFSVVDPRPVEVLMYSPTTPITISGTITAVGNYSGDAQSPNATVLGITHNAVAGTITFPAGMTTTPLVKISASVNIDLTVAGSPANDTDVGMYLTSSVAGDNYVGGNYIVDKNKQNTLPISASFSWIATAGEVINIGIATVGGGSGDIAIDSGQFNIDVIQSF